MTATSARRRRYEPVASLPLTSLTRRLPEHSKHSGSYPVYLSSKQTLLDQLDFIDIIVVDRHGSSEGLAARFSQRYVVCGDCGDFYTR